MEPTTEKLAPSKKTRFDLIIGFATGLFFMLTALFLVSHKPFTAIIFGSTSTHVLASIAVGLMTGLVFALAVYLIFNRTVSDEPFGTSLFVGAGLSLGSNIGPIFHSSIPLALFLSVGFILVILFSFGGFALLIRYKNKKQ